MGLFSRSQKTEFMDTDTDTDPKLIIGQAEKLYPNKVENIKELRLNYSRRLQHLLALGMTGSGKTESVLLNFAGQDIAKGYGVTIFDGKGDYNVFNKVCHLAKNKKQDLYFFAVNENKDISETYNPFSSDISVARKTEMIIKAFFEFNPKTHTDATDYYKGQARQALNMAIAILEAQKKPYNFKDLYYILTEPKILKVLAEKGNLPTHTESLVASFLNNGEKSKGEKISGLPEKLTMLIEDEHINSYNPTLKINEIMDSSKIFFVSLSGTEKEKTIGKIILQDIQNVIQTRQTSRERKDFPLNFVYLDEFSSYVYDGFLLILNKARSANISINIMTQSYGDLARLGDTFAQSILDNTAAKIIPKQDSIENEQVSKLLGQSLQHKTSEGWNDEKIGKNITEDYDFICRPEEIRGFLSGEGVCSLPLKDGVGIYRTRLNWHQELEQAEAIKYTPRKNQETEGLNLEKEVGRFYDTKSE